MAAADAPHEALLPEPRILTRAIRFVADRKGDSTAPPQSGFYVDVGNMPTGAGWISAGPGYRVRTLGGRALVEGSMAISWHASC